MTVEELKQQITSGEDSSQQFKVDVRNADSLASEMADKSAVKGQSTGLSGQTDPINDLLKTLNVDPSAGYLTLAQRFGVSETTVKRNIQMLKQQNRIRRVDSKKTGHGEIVE